MSKEMLAYDEGEIEAQPSKKNFRTSSVLKQKGTHPIIAIISVPWSGYYKFTLKKEMPVSLLTFMGLIFERENVVLYRFESYGRLYHDRVMQHPRPGLTKPFASWAQRV